MVRHHADAGEQFDFGCHGGDISADHGGVVPELGRNRRLRPVGREQMLRQGKGIISKLVAQTRQLRRFGKGNVAVRKNPEPEFHPIARTSHGGSSRKSSSAHSYNARLSMCKRSVWMVAAARVTQTSGGEFADAEDHRKTCSRALRRATTIHYSS